MLNVGIPLDREIKDIDPCSCVSVSRLAVPHIKGNAIDLKPNSFEPKIGSVVLIKFGDMLEEHHTAIIIDETATRLRLFNGNLKPCEFSYSYIKKNDPRIKGYITNLNYIVYN